MKSNLKFKNDSILYHGFKVKIEKSNNGFYCYWSKNKNAISFTKTGRTRMEALKFAKDHIDWRVKKWGE